MSISDVRILNLNFTGIKSKTTLIETGVTEIDGLIIDRNAKIHIHEVDLVASAAGLVTLYLGNTAVVEKTFASAGEEHRQDRDIYIPTNENRILSISVSTNITVTGRIFFSIEYTGGKVIKKSE